MTQQTLGRPQGRLEHGRCALAEIDGALEENVVASLLDIAPDLSRPGLDLPARDIATIAALPALGKATPQHKVDIQAGPNVGPSHEGSVGVLAPTAVLAAFPAALNGPLAASDAYATCSAGRA